MISAGILLSFGLLLVGGAAAGALARVLHLPTVTGYLAAGILLGTRGFDVLPEVHVLSMSSPVNDLAMALVLFVLGGQFRPRRTGPPWRKLFLLSAIESAATAGLVCALTLTVFPNPTGAILLGVIAVAVAPATTVVVLDEYGARGPATTTIKLATALSNVWAVLFFEAAMLLLFATGADAAPGDVAWDAFGSLIVGLVAGHALIFLQDRAGHGDWSLPLLAVLLLTIGGCKLAGVPHMLAFLVTGAVVANRSRFFEPIVQAMGAFAKPAYVAFFVLSGAHLNFALLADHWLVAGLYVLGRTLGKILGARAGLAAARLEDRPANRSTTPPLGLGLLCQAGAAIALARVVAEYDPQLSEELLNVVLGAVVLFELVGPLLLRHVVISAGEVDIGHLLVRDADRDRGFLWLGPIANLMRGRRPPPQDLLAEMTMGSLLRPGVKPLTAGAGLDEILRYANHVRFNQFPVVNADGKLVGVIRLHDLEELAYDPRSARLVIAEGLTTAEGVDAALLADVRLPEAAAAFAETKDNALVVMENTKSCRYLGVVERAEVLRLVRQLQRS